MCVIAAVEPIAFGPDAVIATTRRTSQPSLRLLGRYCGRACATASLPSARSPRAISTKPPKIERAAEPEPTRASADSSGGDSVRPGRARRRQRERREPGRRRRQAGGGRDAVVAGDQRARAQSRRARARDRGTPTRARSRRRRRARRRAPADRVAPSSKATVVRVPSRSSVSDRLPVAGRFNATSRFPQYFTSAILVPATAVTACGALTSRSPGVAAISAMKPSKPAAFQRASTSRSWPGASAIAAPPPPAPVSLAPIAPAARAVCDQRVQLGRRTRAAPHSRPCAASNVRPSPSTSPLPRAPRPLRPSACPARPGCRRSTDSRSRRRATAATCAAVSRCAARQPDAQPDRLVARATGLPARRARRTFRRRRSSPRPRRSPTGCRGRSSPPRRRRRRCRRRSSRRAPAAAAAARATATASAAELPRPARDGNWASTSKSSAGASSRRTIAASARPACAVVAGGRLEAPRRHAQTPAARARRRPRSRPTIPRPAPDVRTRPRARRRESPWRGRARGPSRAFDAGP